MGERPMEMEANSTAQHSTARHSTAPHTTARHTTAQQGTAKQSIVARFESMGTSRDTWMRFLDYGH